MVEWALIQFMKQPFNIQQVCTAVVTHHEKANVVSIYCIYTDKHTYIQIGCWQWRTVISSGDRRINRVIPVFFTIILLLIWDEAGINPAQVILFKQDSQPPLRTESLLSVLQVNIFGRIVVSNRFVQEEWHWYEVRRDEGVVKPSGCRGSGVYSRLIWWGGGQRAVGLHWVYSEGRCSKASCV